MQKKVEDFLFNRNYVFPVFIAAPLDYLCNDSMKMLCLWEVGYSEKTRDSLSRLFLRK